MISSGAAILVTLWLLLITLNSAALRWSLLRPYSAMPSKWPQAVRRVYIPKANGELRPLGIPTLEGWLGLEINRKKTRVVNLKEEGARLDFLGFTFRYYDDLAGRGWRYRNVSPSAKALKKEREKSQR